MPKTNETVNRLIETARNEIGTLSRANRVNGYGARTGFNGSPWDGSFLEHVMRENSVYPGTALTSTTASLAYFHRTNRIYTRPRIGDLAYFAFGTEPFEQPHVGLVTEVKDWKTLHRVTVIEGEANSGMPRGRAEKDGVYERVRFGTDVLAFARPHYAARPKPTPGEVPEYRPSQFIPGKVSKATVNLQTALHRTVGAYGFEKGRFDAQTASAVRRFQIENGLLKADGTVTEETIDALAWATGYELFR